MKKIILTVFACFLLAGITFKVQAGASCCGASKTTTVKEDSGLWLTDFEKAKKLAKEKNLPIVIDFSGSDWCGWCIKLEEEVFSKDEFKKWAKKNVILFLADFPQAIEQTEKVKKQNNDLAKNYKVQGFPTVVVLDKTGKLIDKTGYQAGGAKKYIEHLEKIIASNK